MKIVMDDIKKYFKDKTNTAIFIVLLAVCTYALIVRFKNIGVLSYWGNDWQTFLGTSGILTYGYPRIPSGDIFYNAIFHFYLRVIPSLIFGINEIALRFPSAFFGTLTIPLMFIFIKELLKNKYIALLVSVIVSFNVWQIEFSREIGYYSEYQFFYLLSIYFFYRGFFKGEKKFKYAALVFIFFTMLINALGLTLIFLFVPLLIYKKFKGFFKKDILISFFIAAAMIAGLLICRELFWKADLSFFPTNITPDTANPLLSTLSKYFSAYIPFYHRIFGVLFPKMYYLVFFGVILIILYLFVPGIRNNEENFLNIYSNSKYSVKLPFNLFFLYFIFYSNTVFNGLVNMPGHQSYIYQVHPIFIAIYCYIIFDIGRIVSTFFGNAMINRTEIRKQKNDKIEMPDKDIITDNYPFYLKKSLYFILAAIIFFLTVDWANPISNFRIVDRNNGDPVVSGFAPEDTLTFHPDTKTPAQYIYEHKSPGDIVIAADVFNTYEYTGKIDYWLWTADFANWQPYVYKDGKIYDKFFSVPIIKDLSQLYKIFNTNSDKNVWLIASNSVKVRSYTTPDVTEFLSSQEQYKVVTGSDGVWAAYLFPGTNQPAGNYFFAPRDENIINVKMVGTDPFVIGFGNKKNQPYLKYGWSKMEAQGTWAEKEFSALFLNFKEKQDYTITIDTMAFFDPLKKQEMKIILNGTEIGNVIFQDSNVNQYSFELKKDLIKVDSYNTLEFNYKYQFNPLSMGISSDSRDLSVYFKRIAIQKNNS